MLVVGQFLAGLFALLYNLGPPAQGLPPSQPHELGTSISIINQENTRHLVHRQLTGVFSQLRFFFIDDPSCVELTKPAQHSEHFCHSSVAVCVFPSRLEVWNLLSEDESVLHLSIFIKT